MCCACRSKMRDAAQAHSNMPHVKLASERHAAGMLVRVAGETVCPDSFCSAAHQGVTSSAKPRLVKKNRYVGYKLRTNVLLWHR
jgi:hypothetical protein